MPRLLSCLALLTPVFVTVATPANAQTWDGGGANDNWSTDLNWNTNIVPVNNGTANIVFDGNTRLTPNIDAAWNINSLTFADTAGSFTLTGNTLTIQGGGITHSRTSSDFTNINNNIVVAANQTWNVATGGRLNLNGTVSGTANIVKTGGGQLLLTGANTFSGTTTINDGRLLIGNALALQNSTVVTNVNASLSTGLGFNSATTTATLGGLSGSGNIVLNNNIFNSAVALTVGNNNSSTTYSGVLSGTGSLTKIGTGTLTLTGASTYTGGTTITGGALNVGNTNALQNSTVTVNTANGLQFANTITAATLGQLAGTGNVSLVNGGGNAVALTVGGNNSSTTYSGVLSGTGSLTKIGNGQLLLTGANTFSGTTTLNGGRLLIGNALALQNSTVVTNVNAVTFNGPTGLGFNSPITSITFGGLAGSGNIGLNNTVNTAVALTVGNNNSSTTYSGVLSGTGSLTKIGTGTLTLTGANTFTGSKTVSAGTLQIGNGGTTGSITGNITNNGNVTFNRSNNVTYTNIISGTGSLTKVGSGQLLLTGANTFSGTTTINGGRLLIGNALALQNSTVVTNLNASLSTGLGFNSATTTATLGGLSGSGNIVLNNNIFNSAVALTVGNNNSSTTYSGVLSGTGSLTKIGTGTLTLTGANTFTGSKTVSAGTLQIGNGGTTGSITGNITNNGNVTFNRSDNTTFAGVISGSGSVTKEGTGITTLTNANTYSGATTVNNGTLDVAGSLSTSGSIIVNSGATLAGDGTVGNITLNNGSTLDPGSALAPGTSGSLNATSLLWNGSSTVNFRLSSSVAASDALLFSGGFLKGTGSGFVFDFGNSVTSQIESAINQARNLNNTNDGSFRYTLAQFNGTVGSTGFTNSDFSYAGLDPQLAGQFMLVDNFLYFDATIIPEPGTFSLAAFGTVPFLGYFLRRRIQK